MEIIIEDIIKSIAPQLHVITIETDVINSETPDEFWRELTDEAKRISSLYEVSDINKRPGIAATRQAYKNLGKEPNRYRPSSEALCRRACNVTGKKTSGSAGRTCENSYQEYRCRAVSA